MLLAHLPAMIGKLIDGNLQLHRHGLELGQGQMAKTLDKVSAQLSITFCGLRSAVSRETFSIPACEEFRECRHDPLDLRDLLLFRDGLP
jgi:hypothetical protein